MIKKIFEVQHRLRQKAPDDFYGGNILMARILKTQPSVEPVPGAEFKPAKILVINTPGMLKTIGDSLRLNILDILRKEALTVKQISTKLNQPVSRLYYHVTELEEVGFITQVDTRIKSGIIEKYYRTSSDLFTVDPKLLNTSDEPGGALTALLSAVFNTATEDLMRSLKAGLVNLNSKVDHQADNAVLTGSFFRLRKEKASEFVKKFNELLMELNTEEQQLDEEDESTDSISYGCTIAFYPRVGLNVKK